MPLEFALRPRIRLREGMAPPRRPRWRIPRLALPVAAYWLTAGGITYELIRLHAQPDEPARVESAFVDPAVKSDQKWWQPVPERPVATATERELAAPLTPVSAAVAAPELEPAPLAEEPPVDSAEPFAALALARGPHAKKASHEHDEDDPRADAMPGSSALAHAAVPAPDLAAPPPLGEDIARGVPTLLGAPPPDAPESVASALPSCGAAAASAHRDIDIGQRDDTPDLSRAAIATVLDNGVWIARCDIPMSTSVELCVAIKEGRVIGATVATHPESAAISACVKRRAAGLHFPFSSRVDLAKTHF